MVRGCAVTALEALVFVLLTAVGVRGQGANMLGRPLTNVTHQQVSFNDATHRVALQVITPFVMQDTSLTGNDGETSSDATSGRPTMHSFCGWQKGERVPLHSWSCMVWRVLLNVCAVHEGGLHARRVTCSPVLA
mmetsp:Transcript_30433/g.73395  ORF Transcript_30433/g.73395 Transcript_30433/m.73395 type:complete len:134 (-) Transcript_30433:1647-2048(-)